MNIDYDKLINDSLRPVIEQWYSKQCENMSIAYYLYAREAMPHETIAQPVIAQEAPNTDYWLVKRIATGWTQEAALYSCREALRKEPILHP